MTTVDHDTGDGQRSWSAPAMLVGLLAVMWIVQVVDEVALSDRLEADGIHPRHVDGLLGILWSPFLHAGFGHLLANTLPFLVLGGLVIVHGKGRWLAVTAIVIVVGGALTWAFGRDANHIGASGLVFGYFGYLVGAAFIRRNLTSIATVVVAIVIYGGIVVGFVPRAGISWEGHLFGAVAGLLAARVLTPRRTPDQPRRAADQRGA